MVQYVQETVYSSKQMTVAVWIWYNGRLYLCL